MGNQLLIITIRAIIAGFDRRGKRKAWEGMEEEEAVTTGDRFEILPLLLLLLPRLLSSLLQSFF